MIGFLRHIGIDSNKIKSRNYWEGPKLSRIQQTIVNYISSVNFVLMRATLSNSLTTRLLLLEMAVLLNGLRLLAPTIKGDEEREQVQELVRQYGLAHSRVIPLMKCGYNSKMAYAIATLQHIDDGGMTESFLTKALGSEFVELAKSHADVAV